MSNRVGDQLGNYRLTRFLGKGGFAEVYLGTHVHLGSQAAIKVLLTQFAGAAELEEFRREAQTIVNLIHPHIVRVLDFGVEEETPYLVMDYAPNGTVRQQLPAGQPVAPARLLPYLSQVADALQYAHDQKVIHRDIKPDNLLLGRRNEVLLSDFGIATAAQSTSQQKTQGVAGTAAYMSPEQLQGKPRPSSDLYSLGVVAYEWLTGTRPFVGSFTEVASQHLFTPPPPLREKVPTLSPAIEQVVLTALAKDPRERFGSVRAFARAFELACQEAPPPADPFATQRGAPAPVLPPPAASAPSQRAIPASPPSALPPLAPTGEPTRLPQPPSPPTLAVPPAVPPTERPFSEPPSLVGWGGQRLEPTQEAASTWATSSDPGPTPAPAGIVPAPAPAPRRAASRGKRVAVLVLCASLLLASLGVALFVTRHPQQQNTGAAATATAIAGTQTALTFQTVVAGSATAQAGTATAVAGHPYSAAVPGAGCDTGGASWKNQGNATCLPNALLLDGTGGTYSYGSTTFLGLGYPLPANSTVSVEISRLQGCLYILMEGIYNGYSNMYAQLSICYNSMSVATQARSDNVQGSFNTSGTFTLKLACQQAQCTFFFNDQQVASETAYSTPSLSGVILGVYGGSSAQVSNFVFTPLP